MEAIKWIDKYYDDGERTVLTDSQLNIAGLRTFGRHRQTKAIPALKPHFHEKCIELTYISKGYVAFSLDGHEYKLSGGDIFVVFPNEVHSTGSIPIPTNEMYWLQLDISINKNFLFLNKKWSEFLINSLFQINNRVIKTDNTIIRDLMEKFFYLVHNVKHYNKFEASSLLVLFLHTLLEYDNKVLFKLTPSIAKCLYYILDNISNNITFEDLALIANLSVSRFKQKFKLEMGITPREFINITKIEAAKKMLLDNQSIETIALDLGFNTRSYFSVVFKRYTTYSPKQFLKLNKNMQNKKHVPSKK